MAGENKAQMNSADGYLDLSEVANEDRDALASKIETFYKNDSTVKTRLAYAWDRNHKFLDGNQWIVFDGDRDTGGLWKRLTVSKTNDYIPRPVTNYLFDGYQTLKSYLIKSKPRSTVYPNTQTFRDKVAAKIATLCLEANWERLSEQDNYEYAAACGLTYGTVFKKSYWDTTVANMVKIPKMQIVPKTDPMTGQIIGQEEVPMLDPMTGDKVFEEIPLGDVNTAVIEPYRIALDPSATGLHNARWIMEYSIQPLPWIKETYTKDAPGYTGEAEDIKEEGAVSGSLRRFQQLKNSSGIKNTNFVSEGSTGNSGHADVPNSAVVKEYYERPSVKYPKGRLIVVASNTVLYAGDSPFEGPEHGDWHPYSEFRWEIVPGRFWGKSPLDNAVEIQKNINSIDAVIILTRKTTAIPQRLVPISAGITPGTWTGRPGQEIHYRDSGGAKPETLPPGEVGSTVFTERAQRVEDIKTIMGSIDILKGENPGSVTAASALNLLYEVGTGKIFPCLDRWKRFIECDQKKQLKLIAKYYKEPRKDFIRLLKMKNSELAEESINNFLGTDLYDNCNVIVEAGANVSKLQSAQQLKIQETAQAGIIDFTNPANRVEYLRQMGITGFDGDIGPDTKRAEWENDLLDNISNTPDNKPITLDADNHDIHIEVHQRRMKEPSFVSMSPAVQQGYMQHILEHEQFKQMQQQAQMMEQMASGMPPEPQEQPGAAPLTKAGKGLTQQERSAIHPDVKVPGTPE